MRRVSAAEANRQFSKLLRAAQEGETVLITSRGKTVAKISPADDEAERRAEAKRQLLERLSMQKPMHLGSFNRSDAYDE